MKGAMASCEKRNGKLNMLDNRIEDVCFNLTEITSSIFSKVCRIVDFEPMVGESEQAIDKVQTPYTFSESIEEKIQRLEASVNQLDCINKHLENIIS